MPTWNCGRSHEFTPWHAATLRDKSPYASQGVAAICSNSVRNERKELSLENAVAMSAMYCQGSIFQIQPRAAVWRFGGR